MTVMDFEREDRIVTHFLESIGEWRDHIVIGGGYAPIIYRLYLSSDDNGIYPVGTKDIDSLIPRKVPQVSQEDISTHLKKSGFVQSYRDLEEPPTESYTKEVEGEEIEIEFLTDDSVRKGKDRNIEISGVIAQPLTYLKLSISKTIPFRTRNGLEGIVVSPEAWVFHKGLTFVKRKNRSKSSKDLYGIWYVLTQLGSFSEQAIGDLKDLSDENLSWFKKFKKNISQWIEDASPAEWNELQSQDPFGKMKKLSFLKLMEEVLK